MLKEVADSFMVTEAEIENLLIHMSVRSRWLSLQSSRIPPLGDYSRFENEIVELVTPKVGSQCPID